MTPRTRTLEEVAIGETLPELAVDVTPTLVISGAIASRDLTRVHHDQAEAQRRGLQGVIMNTMTTNGLVSRFVTDWAGPEALVRRIRLKLGAPNVAGDRMTVSGRVESVDTERGEVSIQVAAKNSWGSHAAGSVRLALPRGA